MKRTKKAVPLPDAIVDEVRAVRADLSAQFNDDVESLCAHLRSIEAKYRNRTVVGPGTKKAASRHRLPSATRRTGNPN